MESLLEIRELFNLTQQELADFLDIPRHQVAQAETGNRLIPAEAMIRLSKLLLHSIQEEKDAAGQNNYQPVIVLTTEQQFRLNYCRYKAKKLQGQLLKMKIAQQKTMHWIGSLQQLLDELPVAEIGRERRGLELQLQYAKLNLERYSPAMQLQLQLKIRILQTEADFLEEVVDCSVGYAVEDAAGSRAPDLQDAIREMRKSEVPKANTQAGVSRARSEEPFCEETVSATTQLLMVNSQVRHPVSPPI